MPEEVTLGLRRLAAALRVAPDKTGATSTENPTGSGIIIPLTAFLTCCGGLPPHGELYSDERCDYSSESISRNRLSLIGELNVISRDVAFLAVRHFMPGIGAGTRRTHPSNTHSPLRRI